MGFETQKACLKILLVCCYNHVLNTDLALFKVGFYKPVRLCVGEIQYVIVQARLWCLLAKFVQKT